MTALAVRAYIARWLRKRPAKTNTVPTGPDRDSLDRVWAEVQACMHAEVPSAYRTPTQASRALAKDQ